MIISKPLKFKNSIEARAYMFAKFSRMISSELNDTEGWMLGGIDNDQDNRRLVNELKKYRASVIKRAEKLSGR